MSGMPTAHGDTRMKARDGSEDVRSLSPEQLMEAMAEAREADPYRDPEEDESDEGDEG